MTTIAFQQELRPALPVVFGAKDYREFRSTIEEIDRILTATDLEHRMIAQRIEASNSSKPQQTHYETLQRALRYSILLGITGNSFRELSQRVADSQIFQWFTHTSSVDGVRPAAKSSVERFEKMFTDEEIASLVHDLNRAVSDPAEVQALLYRETALRFDEIFADTTCVKANIHYPTDWIMLRDAVRTLIKAIALIRRHGLKYRISNPQKFLRDMNKLCMEMTHVRKKKGAKKMRKRIFRRMKKLMGIVEKHANNYHRELEARWQETDLSEVETQVILDRMQNILDQLPQAVHQAHERLIGERRVANKDKILSLYEPDVHVLIRGKADAEIEFGNGLYLAEQADGLIVDWALIKEQPPSDSKLVKASIEEITQRYGIPKSYSGDRGFDSISARADLKKDNIFNAICPRSVPMLREKLKEAEFCRLQKRRGGTEARISIFKNAYLGTPLRSKGFKNRTLRNEWCVLTHNLWKLARMALQQKKDIAVKLDLAA